MTFIKRIAALALLGAAAVAQAGPLSTLYLAYTGVGNYQFIGTVQGNTLTSFATNYGGGLEIPIAVDGDVRTTSYSGGFGGQYTLAGAATGVQYTNPGFNAYDGTTDGTYNYVVDYNNGNVVRTDRNYQNPVTLFNIGPGFLGITYDPTNHSLWISSWYVDESVRNYSMNGTLLSSFDAGVGYNGALALDHADGTLWMVDDGNTGNLVQYSKSGTLLSTGPYVNYSLGAEFDLQAAARAPEPAAVVLLGTALLLMARRRRTDAKNQH